MTRIYVFAGILILGAIAASAAESQWEYHEVSIRVSNETLEVKHQLGTCWVCKWIVNKVKHYIGNQNPTKAQVLHQTSFELGPETSHKEQIKNLLTDTCNEIGFLRMICKHLLGKFIDVLVEEISTSDNVNTICAAVKAC